MPDRERDRDDDRGEGDERRGASSRPRRPDQNGRSDGPAPRGQDEPPRREKRSSGVIGEDDLAARALDPQALQAHRRVSGQFKVAPPPGPSDRAKAARVDPSARPPSPPPDGAEPLETRPEAVFSPAFAPAPPREPRGAGLLKALGGTVSRAAAAMGAPRAPGARRLASLTLLAALVALYFGVAFAYALDHATRFAAPAAFGVSAATMLATLILNRYQIFRFEVGAGVIFALSFLLQVNFAAWTDPQPAGGLADLFNDARRLSAGLGAWDVDWTLIEGSQSPAALSVYALTMAAVGDDLSVLRVVSAGLWTLQAWLVWAIARRIAELRDRATLVVALFALNPTILLFGGLPSVEAVFGVFALASAAALFSHRARGLAISALLAGVFAAFAFLTKPLGLGVFAGLMIAIVLSAAAIHGWRRRLPALGAALALAAGFAIGLAPQAALHGARSGALSVAPGAALGYQLLIGANYPGGGAYSEESASVDLARAGFGGGEAISMREADARATAMALERIAEDPLRYAVFAATEKMRRIWSNQREMLAWTRDGAGGAWWSQTGEEALGGRGDGRSIDGTEGARSNPVQTLVDGFYLALLALAALAAARLALSGGAAARDPSRWLIIYSVIGATALTAAFMEARPLAHVGLLPFLALTAPLAVAKKTRRRRQAWSGRSESAAPADEPAVATAAAAAATPIGEQPVEARLAHVLARMSKPPRPERRGDAQPLREAQSPGGSDASFRSDARPASSAPDGAERRAGTSHENAERRGGDPLGDDERIENRTRATREPPSTAPSSRRGARRRGA